MSAEKNTPVAPQILNALSPRDRERLVPHLEPLSLKRGDVLYEPGEALHHAYFPDTAVFALLSLSESGESIEVGLLGDEGVLGIPIFLGSKNMPFRFKVQIPGNAHRMKSDVLQKEFDQCGRFHDLLLLSVHLLVVQIA